MAGKIILLNGTSSSGKSTLAVELKNMLHHYFKTNSLHGDTNYSNLEEVGCHTKFSEDRKEILDFTIASKGYVWLGRFLKGIDAFCYEDVGVIFDMIIPDDHMLRFVAEHFAQHEVHLICVRCDEEVRRQREISRGDRGVGMYRLNSDYIYKHCPYDIAVDTSATSAKELAQEIVEQLKVVAPRVLKEALLTDKTMTEV